MARKTGHNKEKAEKASKEEGATTVEVVSLRCKWKEWTQWSTRLKWRVRGEQLIAETQITYVYRRLRA
jgi:hypothetical protein